MDLESNTTEPVNSVDETNELVLLKKTVIKRKKHKNYTKKQKQDLIEKWLLAKNSQTQREFCKQHRIAGRTLRVWTQDKVLPDDSIKKAERIIRHLSKIIEKAADALATMAYQDQHEILLDETDGTNQENNKLHENALDKFMDEKIDWNTIL
jgi:hypothetical protein